MTSGAFVTVVIAALGFNPLGAFAAGVLLGKICNIGGTVHPDGIHAISVRVLSYQRPSGPGVIGYGTVTQLYTKWYASANQQNYIEDADSATVGGGYEVDCRQSDLSNNVSGAWTRDISSVNNAAYLEGVSRMFAGHEVYLQFSNNLTTPVRVEVNGSWDSN